MKKWFAGVSATVVSGFLLFWLTNANQESSTQPLGQPSAPLTASPASDAVEYLPKVVDGRKSLEKALAKIDSSNDDKEVIRQLWTLGTFHRWVVENGESGTTYAQAANGVEYRATAYDEYINSQGRTFRDIQRSSLSNGKSTDHGFETWVKIRGRWVPPY